MSSKNKFLRFIVGRHDLPFYYKEEVEIQKSFLDAYLKGEDDAGWSSGKVAPVNICLRQGDVGFNNPEAEKRFTRREEGEWPIARTQYTKYYLSSDGGLSKDDAEQPECKISYKALGSLQQQHLVQFTTPQFTETTEFTGHVTAHLNVSVTSSVESLPERQDIDVFVTLRHISTEGREVFYTGSSGDNVPVCKGWLRISLRKVNADHPRYQPYLPYREYLSTDVQPVRDGQVYTIDIELWPTNVVVDKGGKLIFEVSSGDTQGSGLFQHTNPKDRYVYSYNRLLKSVTIITLTCSQTRFCFWRYQFHTFRERSRELYHSSLDPPKRGLKLAKRCDTIFVHQNDRECTSYSNKIMCNQLAVINFTLWLTSVTSF